MLTQKEIVNVERNSSNAITMLDTMTFQLGRGIRGPCYKALWGGRYARPKWKYRSSLGLYLPVVRAS